MKSQLFVLFLAVAATMAFNIREDNNTTAAAPTPTTAVPTNTTAAAPTPTTAVPTNTTAVPTDGSSTAPTDGSSTVSTTTVTTESGASHGIASFTIIVACALAKFL